MRGNKRKRDIFTMVESVDNWFIASEPPISLTNTEEGEGVQAHAKSIGEGSNGSSTIQLNPVSSYVSEEANWWLGLDPNQTL